MGLVFLVLIESLQFSLVLTWYGRLAIIVLHNFKDLLGNDLYICLISGAI